MGEIAEMMLDGTFCEGCGEVMDDHESPGYPRRCEACGGASRPVRAGRPGRSKKRRQQRKRARERLLAAGGAA